MALLTRRSKTKFPTVYPTIYLPNENFEYSYPLIILTCTFLKKELVSQSIDSRKRKVSEIFEFNHLYTVTSKGPLTVVMGITVYRCL